MTTLPGSTLLITGAASGLGRLLCLQGVERGAKVVVWDYDEQALKALLDELPVESVVSSDVVDVTDREAVEAAAQALPGGPACVDVLINNAGIVSGAHLTELTPAQIERTFAVNVLSLYWVTKAFLPTMTARGTGHIVTVASAAGRVGVAKQTDYSASKHAALGFAESLRAELRETAPGLRTTVVCPYYTDTGMFSGVTTRLPWLLPILKQEKVVQKMLGAIDRNQAELNMPPAVGLLAPMRILPTGLFDRAMDLMGVNATMDHFVGRDRTTVAPDGETLPRGSVASG